MREGDGPVPREFYLVSPRAMRLVDLVEAGAKVDGSLVLRALDEGGSLQLVDTDDVAVMTVDVSREVLDRTDVESVVGALGALTGQLWCTQATAPWGAHGAAGSRVVGELSFLLGASVVVAEDGQ